MDYILSKIIKRSPTPSRSTENQEFQNIFAENILESLNVITNQSQVKSIQGTEKLTFIAGSVGSSQQQNPKPVTLANKQKIIESENQPQQLNSRNNILNKTTENGKLDNYDAENIKPIDDISIEEAANTPLPDIVNTLPSISVTESATKFSNSTTELTSELYIDTTNKIINEEEQIYLTPKISGTYSNTSSEDETFKECQSNLSLGFDRHEPSISKFGNNNVDICIEENYSRKGTHSVSDRLNPKVLKPFSIEKVESISKNEFETRLLETADERKSQVNSKWNVLMVEAASNVEDLNDSQIDMNVTPPNVEIDEVLKTKSTYSEELFQPDSSSIILKKDIEVEIEKIDQAVENNKLTDYSEAQPHFTQAHNSYKTTDAKEAFIEKVILNMPNRKSYDSSNVEIRQNQEKDDSKSGFDHNTSSQIISNEPITTMPISNQLIEERKVVGGLEKTPTKNVMSPLETSQNESLNVTDLSEVDCIVDNQFIKTEQLNAEPNLLSPGAETKSLVLNDELTNITDATFQNRNHSHSSVESVMPDFQDYNDAHNVTASNSSKVEICQNQNKDESKSDFYHNTSFQIISNKPITTTPIFNQFIGERQVIGGLEKTPTKIVMSCSLETSQNESLNVSDLGNVDFVATNQFNKTEQLKNESTLLPSGAESKSLIFNNEFTNKVDQDLSHTSVKSVTPDFPVHNDAHKVTTSNFLNQIMTTPISNEFNNDFIEKRQEISSSEKSPVNVRNSLETSQDENLYNKSDFRNGKKIDNRSFKTDQFDDESIILSPLTFVTDVIYQNEKVTNISVESVMTNFQDSNFEKNPVVGNHIESTGSLKSPEKNLNDVEEPESNDQDEHLIPPQASTVLSEENAYSCEVKDKNFSIFKQINLPWNKKSNCSNDLQNSTVTNSHDKKSKKTSQEKTLSSSEITSSPLLEKQTSANDIENVDVDVEKDVQLKNISSGSSFEQQNTAKTVENFNNFHVKQNSSKQHLTQTEQVESNYIKENSPMTDSIELTISNSQTIPSMDSEMFDSLEMQTVSDNSIKSSEDIESKTVSNIPTLESLQDSNNEIDVISSKSEHIVNASLEPTNHNGTFQLNLTNLKNDSIKASEEFKIKSINNLPSLESFNRSDDKNKVLESKPQTILIASPSYCESNLNETVNLKNDLFKVSEGIKIKIGKNLPALESLNQNDKPEGIESKPDHMLNEFSISEETTTDPYENAELRSPNSKSVNSSSNVSQNIVMDIESLFNRTIDLKNDRSSLNSNESLNANDKINTSKTNNQSIDYLNRTYSNSSGTLNNSNISSASDLNTTFYSQSSSTGSLSDCATSLNNKESEDEISQCFKNYISNDTLFKLPQTNSNNKKLSPKVADDSFDSKAIFFTPRDFDFLLTKGNNNIEVDRNSILLKFDPLLGRPVLANQQQQQSAQKTNHTQNIQLSQNEHVQKLTPSSVESKEELCEKLSKLSNKQINIGTDLDKALSLNKENKLNERKIDNLVKKITENQKRVVSVENLKRIRSEKGNVKMSVDVIRDLKINNLGSKEADEKLILKMEEQEKKVQNDSIKSEELEKKLKETEQHLKESEHREEALLKRITEKDKTIAKLGGVIEAYEKAIAEAIAEKEQITQNYEKQLQEIQNERDLNSQHLASLESTFTDLHLKYERSKLITAKLKTSGEELLAERNKDLENLRLQEQRYEKMKNHAMQQLEIANNKLEFLTKNQTLEMTKLKALLKKEEISKASTQEQFQQKCRENDELMKICDELINGGQNS